MKTFWITLAVVAAALGAWWWFTRRAQGVDVGNRLFPPAPPEGSYAAAADYSNGSPSLAGRAIAAGNQAIGTFGNVSEDVFRSLCKSGSACEYGAPVAKLAGQATAAITVKSFEYAAKGVAAAAGKLKFW